MLSIDCMLIVFILLAPYLDHKNTYLLTIFLLLTASALYLENTKSIQCLPAALIHVLQSLKFPKLTIPTQ